MRKDARSSGFFGGAFALGGQRTLHIAAAQAASAHVQAHGAAFHHHANLLDVRRPSTVIVVHGEGKVLAKFPYVMAGPDRLTGTWPQENVIGRITSGNVAIAAKDARPYPFPYPLAGTKPQENTIGRAVSSAVIASHAAEGHVFPYPAASENTKSGTIPQENTLGVIAKADAAAQSDGKATAFSYAPCASEKLCGDDAL